MVRHGYHDEAYNGSLGRAENGYIGEIQDGSNHSSNEDMQQRAHSDSQWTSFDFENYNDHGWRGPSPSYDNSWSETKLYESIFGHWPCLVHPDLESQAATSH
ncbi:hypothetical protein ACH5RR_005390 [Cinchona calisaya]|uniref:Uncharacterized protein n=1 Tax=Cinchona calisaya TaxID=153742 RepID=A0ABD3AL19_9GENT